MWHALFQIKTKHRRPKFIGLEHNFALKSIASHQTAALMVAVNEQTRKVPKGSEQERPGV